MNKNNISISSYSENTPQVNCMRVDIGSLVLWFSYETIVAFRSPESDGLVVCENAWGTTTGKHLNWIDNGNKKDRLDHETFNAKLNETLAKFGLSSERR